MKTGDTCLVPSPSHGRFKVPGIKTDEKVVYQLNRSLFEPSKLFDAVYGPNQDIHIRIEKKAPCNSSKTLRELAIASGEWSRFKVDSNIPEKVFHGIFGAWLDNSVNRSIADEVFVATLSATCQDVGFITVKRQGDTVTIGLLAVDSSFRFVNLMIHWVHFKTCAFNDLGVEG